VNVEGELRLRDRIMYLLTQAVAASADGTLSRTQLSAFDVDGTSRRLIDASRGIWNPKELQATLAIVSSPTGPYADEPLDSGLFRYDYRAGSDAGDNTKLRRAYELNLPLILFRKISPGTYTRRFPSTSWRTIEQPDRCTSRWTRACDSCAIRCIPNPTNVDTPSAWLSNDYISQHFALGCCVRIRFAARSAPSNTAICWTPRT
jgi:hypothetical protein